MHAFERAFVSAIVALALGSLDVEAQQPPPGPDVAANPDGGMAPLSPEQQAYVEQLIEKRLAQYSADQAAMAPPPPPPPTLSMRADVYTKFLFQNDQSNGSVT